VRSPLKTSLLAGHHNGYVDSVQQRLVYGCDCTLAGRQLWYPTDWVLCQSTQTLQWYFCIDLLLHFHISSIYLFFASHNNLRDSTFDDFIVSEAKWHWAVCVDSWRTVCLIECYVWDNQRNVWIWAITWRLRFWKLYKASVVSDIAIFVLKRDVKLQLTN